MDKQELEQLALRLKNLPPEVLTKALCDLALRDERAFDMVKRLVSTPEENTALLKKRIAGIKRSKRFVRWGESAELANELDAVVDDISASISDAETGIELILAFIQTESGVFERSDDSSGYIGGVYRYAAEIFWRYASATNDKNKLIKSLQKLLQQDDYGVRGELLERANTFLNEQQMRKLLAHFSEMPRSNDKWQNSRHMSYCATLAKQLHDADLFAELLIAQYGESSPAACIDIAQVYFDNQQADKALQWLLKMPDTIEFKRDERERLLLKTYIALNDQAQRITLAEKIFNRQHSKTHLQWLLDAVGHEQRDRIVGEVLAQLKNHSAPSAIDLNFLIEIDEITAARDYIYRFSTQLNALHYTQMTKLVAAFEAAGEPLAASLLYRQLLLDILTNAKTTAYKHGACYWNQLTLLANDINDWQSQATHQAFAAQVKLQHGRKQSFWSLTAST